MPVLLLALGYIARTRHMHMLSFVLAAGSTERRNLLLFALQQEEIITFGTCFPAAWETPKMASIGVLLVVFPCQDLLGAAVHRLINGLQPLFVAAPLSLGEFLRPGSTLENWEGKQR